MKELIIQAITEAINHLERNTPQTKTSRVEFDILNKVEPDEISQFMIDNNINPKLAYFSGEDNGYDGYSTFLLCYDIEIPTTEKDKLKYKRDNADRVFSSYVNKSLNNNGYKRIPNNSFLLKEFKDLNFYDLYIKGDFDTLIKYHSLSHKKENE